jgi:hypothetical protein
MDPLDPTIQERLVAYLDGELDAAESRRVEELLANDPRVRAALQRLDRTWELLDELDTPPVREGLTRTTLEMVAVAAAQDAEAAEAEAPRRRRRGRLLAAGLLAAVGLAGFLAVLTLLPDANRQLLHDLPLLENLDQYREIDDLDFLRLLARAKLFPDEGDAGGSEETESWAARRERIKDMTPVQKDQLWKRQQQFQKLDPGQQQRVRELHEQLEHDAEAGRLRNVLAHYCQWLSALPAYPADLKGLPPEERLQRVKNLQKEQAARQLSPEDREAIVRWIDRYARQHADRMLAMISEKRKPQLAKLGPAGRHRMAVGMLYQRWQSANAASLGLLGSDVLADLRGGLSPQTRARLEEKPLNEQWQIVAEWVRQVARQQAARRGPGAMLPNLDEQLAHYFEHGLSDQQRDRLMSLPGEEMQQQLRAMFDRDQHGKKLSGPPGAAARKGGKADKPKGQDATP